MRISTVLRSQLFGLRGKPRLIGTRTLEPMERFGLKVMSIGFLVKEDLAMIWRGPMAISAITQMMREVAWGDLDVFAEVLQLRVQPEPLCRGTREGRFQH